MVDFTKYLDETIDWYHANDTKLFQEKMQHKKDILTAVVNDISNRMKKSLPGTMPIEFYVPYDDWKFIEKEFAIGLPKGFILKVKALVDDEKTFQCRLYCAFDADLTNEALFSFDGIDWATIIETARVHHYLYKPATYDRAVLRAALQTIGTEFDKDKNEAVVWKKPFFYVAVPGSPNNILRNIFERTLPPDLQATFAEPIRGNGSMFQITRKGPQKRTRDPE